MDIRIHPKGSGKTTDHNMERKLREENSAALLLSQNILTATAKYIKKSGLFSTETSRLQKIQRLCYQLDKEIKKDPIYSSIDSKSRLEFYLSKVSDTYPNWQDEYKELNRLIPLFF